MNATVATAPTGKELVPMLVSVADSLIGMAEAFAQRLTYHPVTYPQPGSTHRLVSLHEPHQGNQDERAVYLTLE